MPMPSNARATRRPDVAPSDEGSNAVVECSSPPCLLHELDPSWLGAPLPWAEVRAWRKTRRAALIADRLAVPRDQRARRDAVIAPRIRAALPPPRDIMIGIYWPFRGEFDLRPLARALHGEGARLALPVVVAKGAPMVFRPWTPGASLVPGIWNIPVPATGEPVSPDVLLVPLVGFDAGGYRLGYGGGYYDRTLAATPNRPTVIGVGFQQARLSTIHPQPHDIPMDIIITEDRTIRLRQAMSPGDR